MRKVLQVCVVALVAALSMVAIASAAHTEWHGSDSGSTYNDGVVTLNSFGQADGTSFENEHVSVLVENGDTISFEYMGECGGGAPRVFIQAGAYNTFDQDPNGTACGSDTDGDGWFTVTQTISGITAGEAGHVGIVNDNISDPRIIQVRNLLIDGVAVLPPNEPTTMDDCKGSGWTEYGTMFKNSGDCQAFVRTRGKNEPGKNTRK